MCKIIVNLSNNECKNNNNSTGHLNNIQKLSLLSIFDISEKDVVVVCSWSPGRKACPNYEAVWDRTGLLL